MNLNIPSTLTGYLDRNRKSKCRAWFIINCIRYVKENNIDIYDHYEGNDERTNKTNKEGKD